MNFTLDACVAALILAVALAYFADSVAGAAWGAREHYDDSLVVLGRLLRHYDLQRAVYSNNSALVEAVIRAAMHPSHEYYLAVVDLESEAVVLECGSSRLSSHLASVTLPGWNGTLRPLVICFRVGVGG